MRHIHSQMWLWAGRAQQIERPGDFLVQQVAGANVIVVRGDDGAVRAFHNVCRHRGTLLCNEEPGHAPRKIRCPYHAWTYDLAGRLVGAPHMDKVEGFREQDHPLGDVAAAVWDGHVFINLSEQPQPFAGHVGELAERLRPWRMEELVRVERRVYPVRANWKLIVQNYSECLHCPVAHPLLHEQSHYMSGENDARRSPPGWAGTWSCATASRPSAWTGAAAAPASPCARRRAARCTTMRCCPTCCSDLHPDYMLTLTLWPRGVDRTDVVGDWHFHPRRGPPAGLRPAELDRLLGPDQPPGLGALRARAGRHHLARLSSRPLFEPGGAAAARLRPLRAGPYRRPLTAPALLLPRVLPAALRYPKMDTSGGRDMSDSATTRLPDILGRFHREILAEWLRLQQALTRRRDLVSDDALHQQCAAFLEGRARGRAAADLDLQGAAWQPVRDLLKDLSVNRARLGLSPSETATFVLSLKQPIFARLNARAGAGRSGAGRERGPCYEAAGRARRSTRPRSTRRAARR